MPKKKHKKKKNLMTTKNADKYVLYTESVQCPESEVDFLVRVYRKRNDKLPVIVREDFCGTAAICCEWVKRNENGISIGVDLDPEPLAWGRQHYVSKLNADQADRVRLLQDDVLAVRTEPVDVILALNFSFCVFKERSVLLAYLRRCREALADDGIMVMDIYGGPEAQKPNEDITEKDGFDYVWDQAKYNPITNEALNHIHFDFPKGPRMRKAFTYDWRLWTLAELSDAMADAGFAESRVYWEGTDEDGDGNGVFKVRKHAEVEDAWVAYIVGFK